MNVIHTVPKSLQREELKPVWQAVRQQLDRHGPARRGSVALPKIGLDVQLVLASLLGTKPRARLDLAVLETALVTQGVGFDHDDALTHLEIPPSAESVEKRRQKQVRNEARAAVGDTLRGWQEPWSHEYGEWLFRSGQMVNADVDSALRLLEQVRCLLNAVANAADGPGLSDTLARTELAVSLFGSSHALDDGVLLERCARRAILLQTCDGKLDYQRGRDVWSAAGVQTDRVSAPVLVWRLPLKPDTTLGAISTAADADAANVPMHLTEIALQSHALEFNARSEVLVFENPRLVEFAIEQRVPQCVISTNGNPSTAVILLIDSLITAGIKVNVHADFDSAGIAICRRLAERGCQPWRMTAKDYEKAVHDARMRQLPLPSDSSLCGPTPWNGELENSFNQHRAIVHEELIIDELLGST